MKSITNMTSGEIQISCQKCGKKWRVQRGKTLVCQKDKKVCQMQEDLEHRWSQK